MKLQENKKAQELRDEIFRRMSADRKLKAGSQLFVLCQRLGFNKQRRMNRAREESLAAMLAVIEERPGIRPKELNLLLGLEHSSSLRNTLIKGGLVREERRGTAVQYYPVRRRGEG